MKKLITTFAFSLLLFGCSKLESQAQASSNGFAVGSSRDAVVKQLEQIHAKILRDKPELLRAAFSAPELKWPMEVELGFADGKLNSVNYIPVSNAPTNSVIKQDAELEKLGSNASPADTASRTNWQYNTITNTSFRLDPRVATIYSEGWDFFGFEVEPARVGGANRPERVIVKFRKTQGRSRTELKKQKVDAFRLKYPDVPVIEWKDLVSSAMVKAQMDFPKNSLVIADARLQDVFERDGKTFGLFSSVFLMFEIDMTDKLKASVVDARRDTEWVLVIRLSSIRTSSKTKVNRISQHDWPGAVAIEYDYFRVEGACVEIEPVKERS